MSEAKTYTLPDNEDHYGMIDYELGYDLKEEKFIPEMKTFIREENGVPNNGCMVKVIYDLDTISQQYLVLEPQVVTPTQGFASHPGIEEVGVILEGNGLVEFPDGESHELRPGDCWYFEEGQPHRFTNNSKSLLKFFVAHTSPVADIKREIVTEGGSKEGHKVLNIDETVPKMAPGFTGNPADAGHYTSLMFEGNNICVLHPTQCPGNGSPMIDYVSHPNVHELEFALSGHATVIMPDKAYDLTPRIARYNPPLQPSKTWNNYDEDLQLLVWYSTGKLENVKRIHNHAVTFEIRN